MKELALLKPIKIKSSLGNYEVLFENPNKIYNLNNNDNENFFYLVDKNIRDIYYKNISNKNIIELTISESIKTLSIVENIIKKLRILGANKKSTLIVLGGGISQDIGTMVASIFMRGINWILIPTTLLSMVDSCIGGKSSINVDKFKNIAGNFYPPKNIMIYIKYCTSLDNSKVIEGLCEAIKIIYASSPEKFENLMSNFSFEEIKNLENLENITYISLLNKKKFIEKDEFDKNIRLLLNFGHTFGHAIETASNYQIPHGVAIGIGMLLAINHSENKNVRNLEVLKTYIKVFLNQWDNLTKLLKLLKPTDILEAFENDKKHFLKHYRMILPSDENGNLKLFEIEKNAFERSKIISNFNKINNLIV